MRPAVTELTTVADDVAIFHHGDDVRVYGSLQPDTTYELEGTVLRTLPRLGQRLCTFATVNDVHFGEVECGVIEGLDTPRFTVPAGAEPYPQVMSRGAVSEIAAIDPVAVIAKGDLTSDGTPAQYREFLACYEPAFGARLVHIRGNHDAYQATDVAPRGPIEIVLDGVRLAVIDTTAPGRPNGALGAEQLDWLDELAARSDRPVLVLGHHHIWDPDHDADVDWYFGIRPVDSRALVALVARRPSIRGYFAGHTHRNRVVRLAATGDLPWAEIASVKDFPGSWAEYRVFDGGVLQVHRRVSTPDALAWSNRTRDLYQPFDYVEYAFGRLADRCFALRW